MISAQNTWKQELCFLKVFGLPQNFKKKFFVLPKEGGFCCEFREFFTNFLTKKLQEKDSIFKKTGGSVVYSNEGSGNFGNYSKYGILVDFNFERKKVDILVNEA